MAAAKKTTAKKRQAAAPKGGDRIGRGTRWTEEQVSLLLETVTSSRTAKEAFEAVAKQLGKSTGTVQQKYYNLQKQAGGGSGRRRGRPAGSTRAAATASSARSPRQANSLPTATDLRALTVDELVSLATRVKGEVDRRKQELDAASKLLKG